MRVDKVEFGDALASRRSFWTKEDDEWLNKRSVIRRIGIRVEDHIGGFSVIPYRSSENGLVLSSSINGAMFRCRADKNGCVICGMTNLTTLGSSSPKIDVPIVENVFLTNTLSIMEMETFHLDSVASIPSIRMNEGMSEGPPSLLIYRKCLNSIPNVWSHICELPDGTILLDLDTSEYHIHELLIPDNHRRCLRYEGYLMKSGTLCYDATPIVLSEDGRTASWSIGLIIPDPCRLKRFTFPNLN